MLIETKRNPNSIQIFNLEINVSEHVSIFNELDDCNVFFLVRWKLSFHHFRQNIIFSKKFRNYIHQSMFVNDTNETDVRYKHDRLVFVQ